MLRPYLSVSYTTAPMRSLNIKIIKSLVGDIVKRNSTLGTRSVPAPLIPELQASDTGWVGAMNSRDQQIVANIRDNIIAIRCKGIAEEL